MFHCLANVELTAGIKSLSIDDDLNGFIVVLNSSGRIILISDNAEFYLRKNVVSRKKNSFHFSWRLINCLLFDSASTLSSTNEYLRLCQQRRPWINSWNSVDGNHRRTPNDLYLDFASRKATEPFSHGNQGFIYLSFFSKKKTKRNAQRDFVFL